MQKDFVRDQISDYQSVNSNTNGPIRTSNGKEIDTLTSTLTSHPRYGDILLKDFNFIDHLASFDRERIPERVVHAKGAGAFGSFILETDYLEKYCKAKIFQGSNINKDVPIAIRFSTVGGESGSADTVRDPRGFAVKFYTEEGNWDLVGNNTPIFFIRDPILFPSFIHTQKRNPATNCKDPIAMWDFFSLRPETTHQNIILFSDRGIPDGYRHMHGFGSHTFKLISATNEEVYVKFHFKTEQGVKNLSVEKAFELSASDPDYATRDLYQAIASGNFPSWKLYVQIMTPKEAESHEFNPFDVTKVWSQKKFPLNYVGKIVLNRNPNNYFEEIEQIAFSPSHFIPGIDASPDKMLQGRLFSYPDTQRYRLGKNYQQIPVNCPFMVRNPGDSYRRSGESTQLNEGGKPNYFPNSFTSVEQKKKTDESLKPTHKYEACPRHYESGFCQDNFTQAGILVREVLNNDERERLINNIASSLKDVYPHNEIILRTISNYSAVDNEFGQSILKKVEELVNNKITLTKCPFNKANL